MRGVRPIIVKEDMEHPLIGRPVLDEMGFVVGQHLDSVRNKIHLPDLSHIGEELWIWFRGKSTSGLCTEQIPPARLQPHWRGAFGYGFVASQHLDSVRDKFHLHDFRHIGEELFNKRKQPLGVLPKLLLMPADIPEFFEDLPDMLALAKKRNMKRREQAKLHVLDEDQSDVQRGEVDDGDHDMLQSNVKFASLKEQALFSSDIPDDDPIESHDVDVGQGSPEELADAIEGLLTSAEQTGMYLDGVLSLRQLVTECKDIIRRKLGTDPPANVKPLVIKLRDGAKAVRMSARK
jgi:hypothetical protein